MPSGFPRPFIRPSFSTRCSIKKVFAKRSRVRVCIVGLLLAIGGGCAVLPGHWRPGWNKEWTSKEPVPQTAGSWNLTELETKDNRFLALAISGGGSRAANFGSAVMLELQQRKLLEQVDVISGVSGGTLPAVYYGLGDKAGAFTEPAVRKSLGFDFQSSWIWRWFLPHNIFRYWLSDFTRSDIMVQVFNNELYHDATFADLQSHPKILLNSTVHNDHTRFTFTDERFARLHSALAFYPVANAVNASSAFPGAFQDVTLEWYINPRQYVHLYDGGRIKRCAAACRSTTAINAAARCATLLFDSSCMRAKRRRVWPSASRRSRPSSGSARTNRMICSPLRSC